MTNFEETYAGIWTTATVQCIERFLFKDCRRKQFGVGLIDVRLMILESIYHFITFQEEKKDLQRMSFR